MGAPRELPEHVSATLPTRRPDVITLLLVACALLVAVLATVRAVPSLRTGQRESLDDRSRVLRQVATTGTMVIGSDDANVRVTIFSDYECEGCALIHQIFRDLQSLHPGKLAIVHRHYPLTRIHPNAFEASIAAECAGDQNRFVPMHEALLRRQREIGTRTWLEFGREAGIANEAEFERCLRSSSAARRVEADRRLALDLRIRGTPAIIVGDELFYGPQAADAAERLLTGNR